MVDNRVDLHIHHDNEHTAQILEESQANGVSVLGALEHVAIVTDKAVDFKFQARQQGIDVLHGVEVLMHHGLNGNGVQAYYELICLGFDLSAPQIFEHLDPRGKKFMSVHKEKIDFQINYLREQGFDMDLTDQTRDLWQEVNSGLNPGTAYPLCQIAIINPGNLGQMSEIERKNAEEIAEVRARRARSITDFADLLYQMHFAQFKPGFRSWRKPVDPLQLTDVVHQAGGIVVIAHPRFQHAEGMPEPITFLDKLLRTLDVDGAEGYDAGPLDQEVAEITKKYGKLSCLGGSGKSFKYTNRTIGYGDIDRRDMFMPPSIMDEISKYKAKIGLREVD